MEIVSSYSVGVVVFGALLMLKRSRVIFFESLRHLGKKTEINIEIFPPNGAVKEEKRYMANIMIDGQNSVTHIH